MGNWRTVNIEGTIDQADVPAAIARVEIGDDWADFHPLAFVGLSLCGLGRWIPRDGGQILQIGNLAERDYSVEDVAGALRTLVAVAPSLTVRVHCGGDWESQECVATITVADGEVSVGPPQVETVGQGMDGQAEGRLLRMLTSPKELW